MSPHLDAERTTGLVYGLLEESERAAAHAHLSGCPSCAEAARRMEEERELVVEASAPAPVREEFVRAIAARTVERVVSIRRARTRKLLVLGAAASLFVAAGVALLTRTREIVESPRSAFAAGRLSVQRGGFWIPQAPGYVPVSGDRLRTDDPAGATIHLEEGSRFSISRGTMVEFRGKRGPSPVLLLLEGEVHCQVVADPRPFSLEAAGSTVTVVGTEFAVHVLEDQPFFKPDKRIPRPPKVGMLVNSGAVMFGTPEGEIRVPAGWVALAGSKGTPWMWGEIKELASDQILERVLKKSAGTKPAAAAPVETAWLERADAAVELCVNDVPWARFADALVWFHKEKDDAVREQRGVQLSDPDVTPRLVLGWTKIKSLAAELNVPGNYMQACRNTLASRRFVDAIVEAMCGASLSYEQRRRLSIPEALDNLLPVLDPAAPALQRWKTRAERTIAFLRQLKEVLPEGAYARVIRTVGPSFMIDNYRVWLIEASSVEEAADRLVRNWAEQFQLPSYAYAPLGEIAAGHVKRHREAQDRLHRADGPPTGLDELEVSVRLFELQAQAEKAISEIPALNGESRARAAEGSPSLFRIRIAE
jgi:hypothetical protein